MEIEDFVKIEKEDFHRVPIGTFIRWMKKDNTLTSGGTVIAISNKDGNRKWILQIMGGKTIQLLWTIEFIYIIKPLFYDYFNSQITMLNNLVKFLTEQLDTRLDSILDNEEGNSFADDYKTALSNGNAKINNERKKLRAAIVTRRSKKKLTRAKSEKKIVIN